MMLKNICEWEKRASKRLKNIQLSNSWKTIGYSIVGIIIFLMILKRIVDIPILTKVFYQNILIVGLLIVSLSKEKVEDELIVKLRGVSYRMAFIFAVFYGLLQPVINYVVDVILGMPDKDSPFSYFQLLIFMLLIQVGFFELFKRNR